MSQPSHIETRACSRVVARWEREDGIRIHADETRNLGYSLEGGAHSDVEEDAVGDHDEEDVHGVHRGAARLHQGDGQGQQAPANTRAREWVVFRGPVFTHPNDDFGQKTVVGAGDRPTMPPRR